MPSSGESVAFAGDLLVTGPWGVGPDLLWDARTGKRLREIDTHPSATWNVVFSPDGRYFANANHADGIKLWAVSRTESEQALELTPLKSLPGCYIGLAFSPDGSSIAFTRNGTPDDRNAHQVYLWKFNQDTPPLALATNFSAGKLDLAFTSDGQHLLKSDSDRIVVAFDVASGKEAYRFPLDVLSGTQLAEAKRPRAWGGTAYLLLSPDGTKLANTSLSERGVEVRDPKSGRLLYALPEQAGAIWCIAWSPDSQRLAISRSDGDISIWNIWEIERVLGSVNLPQ
jgi:WD40 repeat protein